MSKVFRQGIWSEMEKKDIRIQLVISPSEVAALDDWRAKRRIWSRSAAIRHLIAAGLKAEEERES